MDEILEQLQPIFQDILDQPHLLITRDSSAQNVEDWDSLAHINLVTAVERHFKIKFAVGELQELKNVGDGALDRLNLYGQNSRQSGC